MTARAPILSAVPDADLPIYPIGSDERLNNWFFRFESVRWWNSEMCLSADPEVGYAYLNLIFIAQDQTPKGTLPTDRRLLARLLRMPVEVFEGLCRRTPSPLNHWVPCETDRGEVRLMHHVVMETLLEQIHDRERRDAATSADGARKRLDRLRAAMQRAGFDRAVIEDAALVNRLDSWLTENHKGNRNVPAYDRAFAHAARNKWFAQRGGKPLI